MFYEEKEINGYWFYRHTPDGPWTALSVQRLNAKIAELRERIQDLTRALEAYDYAD